MTQFAMPFHVIPTCIDGCCGDHLANPEHGPGECHAYTAVGSTGMGEGSAPEVVRVGLGRSASPAEGAGAYVHVGVTIPDPCFTPEQARELAFLLLAAADNADTYRVPDALVHASWLAA